MPPHLDELIPLLQVAISPVILISGVGLLLLSMTNRFGRLVDRARALAHELRGSEADAAARVRVQITILYRRAHWMRTAIALAAVSVLLAAVLVILLFTGELLGIPLVRTVSVTFTACMVSLIGAMLAFLYDIHLSLVALKFELGPQPRAEG